LAIAPKSCIPATGNCLLYAALVTTGIKQLFARLFLLFNYS
jgi:hypothetical protein